MQQGFLCCLILFICIFIIIYISPKYLEWIAAKALARITALRTERLVTKWYLKRFEDERL